MSFSIPKEILAGFLGLVAVTAFLGVLIGLSVNNAIPDDDATDEGNVTTMATDDVTEAPTTAPPTPVDPGPFASYSYAAVATDAPYCSAIGKEIMANQGGSATDAAIATAICVGTVNRQSTGVGGGNFMTIYDTPKGESKKRVVTVMARETAPAAATEDMFVNTTDASTVGGLSVAVPGEVMGYYEAWKMFGKIPWSDLITPSVKLSREGFGIPMELAFAIRSNEAIIRNDSNLAAVLLHPNGSLLMEGDVLVDEKYAVTLERIAADPMAFYNGSLAEDIIEDLNEYGGIITLDDLRSYTVEMKDAVTTTLYNGNLTLHAPPPPSSGVVLNYIMKILDGYMMNNMSLSTLNGQILTYHRMVEAFKFAYAERSALGDANFVDVEEMVQRMMSDEFTNSIRSKIDDDATGEDVFWYNPSFENVEDSGTSQISVLGADGSAVSITNTINLFFGSKIRGSRTGIFFNNEMDDFSTPGTVNTFGFAASPSNFIAPGKRPMSSMSPLVVLDQAGRPILVTGASGGSFIITATAFVSIHCLWLGDRLQTATERYRLHHQLFPNIVKYEENFNQAIISGLEAKGHETEQFEIYYGFVDSVYNECPICGDKCVKCIHAASDPRKGGTPDGF